MQLSLVTSSFREKPKSSFFVQMEHHQTIHVVNCETLRNDYQSWVQNFGRLVCLHEGKIKVELTKEIIVIKYSALSTSRETERMQPELTIKLRQQREKSSSPATNFSKCVSLWFFLKKFFAFEPSFCFLKLTKQLMFYYHFNSIHFTGQPFLALRSRVALSNIKFFQSKFCASFCLQFCCFAMLVAFKNETR